MSPAAGTAPVDVKKALVEPSGRVAQIVEAGAEFLVNPALRWVECPDGTQTEDTWDGAAFQARPVVSQIADPNLPLIAALAEIADAAGVRDKLSAKTRELLDRAAPPEPPI